MNEESLISHLRKPQAVRETPKRFAPYHFITSLFKPTPWAIPQKARPVTPSVQTLSWQLGIPVEVLLPFSGRQRDARYHYRALKLSKPNGGTRQIYAPSEPLKALQRTVLRQYLVNLPLHDAATGFRRGMSIADNARRHLGQAVVATADITNFFDHTSTRRVREYFRRQCWDAHASAILTGLCTFRGALPQGAPTSPTLSNGVNVPLDKALSLLARKSGARYTRYGDDLTFSWATARRMPHTMQRGVQRVLLSFGYTLNRHKGWRVWRLHRGEEAYITGVVLGCDGRLHPQPTIKTAMRQLRHQDHDAHTQAQLRGYEGFVNMLEKK